MSKYFSNTSNIDTTHIKTQEVHRAIVQPVIRETLSNYDRDTLNNNTQTIEDEILQVAAQSAIVNETMNEINRINPRKIEDTLKSFKPAELFERLNQITFLMIEMNNRLTAIESILSKSSRLETHPDEEPEKPLSPREMFDQNNTSSPSMSVEEARKLMTEKINEKKIPGIPSEDYIDKGVKLEEIFPKQSNEAIQAAYETISESEKELNNGIRYSKSPRGGMNGIRF